MDSTSCKFHRVSLASPATTNARDRVTLFGLTEVQFGTSGQWVGELMRIWGGYDLLRWIQQTAESRLLSQVDYSALSVALRVKLRSNRCAAARVVTKSCFCWHSRCRSRKRIPQELGFYWTNHQSPR